MLPPLFSRFPWSPTDDLVTWKDPFLGHEVSDEALQGPGNTTLFSHPNNSRRYLFIFPLSNIFFLLFYCHFYNLQSRYFLFSFNLYFIHLLSTIKMFYSESLLILFYNEVFFIYTQQQLFFHCGLLSFNQ